MLRKTKLINVDYSVTLKTPEHSNVEGNKVADKPAENNVKNNL